MSSGTICEQGRYGLPFDVPSSQYGEITLLSIFNTTETDAGYTATIVRVEIIIGFPYPRSLLVSTTMDMTWRKERLCKPEGSG